MFNSKEDERVFWNNLWSMATALEHMPRWHLPPAGFAPIVKLCLSRLQALDAPSPEVKASWTDAYKVGQEVILFAPEPMPAKWDNAVVFEVTKESVKCRVAGTIEVTIKAEKDIRPITPPQPDAVSAFFDWAKTNRADKWNPMYPYLGDALAAWQSGDYKSRAEWGKTTKAERYSAQYAITKREEEISSLKIVHKNICTDYNDAMVRMKDLEAELQAANGREAEARRELAQMETRLRASQKEAETLAHRFELAQQRPDAACYAEMVKIVEKAAQLQTTRHFLGGKLLDSILARAKSAQPHPREAVNKRLMEACVKWREVSVHPNPGSREIDLMKAIDAAKSLPTLPYEEVLALIEAVRGARRWFDSRTGISNGNRALCDLFDTLAAFDNVNGGKP